MTELLELKYNLKKTVKIFSNIEGFLLISLIL